MIEAIIKPVHMDEVEAALKKIGVEEIGVEEIMISRLKNDFFQNRERLFYRGAEYVADFMERMKIEIIAADELANKIIEAIGKIAQREGKWDCRIFVLPVVEAL